MPVEMTIKLEWSALARVGLDPQGKLVFPRVSSQPGLYRFEFDGAKGRQVYIGETDTLDRRFQHYRTPGPSQSTNIRLNALMREVINSAGLVGVSIMVDGAALTMAGRTKSPRMQSKRCFGHIGFLIDGGRFLRSAWQPRLQQRLQYLLRKRFSDPTALTA